MTTFYVKLEIVRTFRLVCAVSQTGYHDVAVAQAVGCMRNAQFLTPNFFWFNNL